VGNRFSSSCPIISLIILVISRLLIISCDDGTRPENLIPKKKTSEDATAAVTVERIDLLRIKILQKTDPLRILE